MALSKVIHQFWAGSTLPSNYRYYHHLWKRFNPSWEVVLWRETDALRVLPDSLNAVVQDLYERDAGKLGIELYVQMADVVGYALVHQYGGAYFNCDMQPVNPLPEPMPDKAWASYENGLGDVVNAAIGAPSPENEFWAELIEELPSRYFSNPTAEMVATTGPGLLTDLQKRRPGLLHVFPVETFNPVHWSTISFGSDASGFAPGPETIAVHHWGHRKDRRSNTVETGTQR